MRIIVIGGSASKVGKTLLACHLIARAAPLGRVAALKVSTHPNRHAADISVHVASPVTGSRHDTDRYLAAGASIALLLEAGAHDVRSHLAAGLRCVRKFRPATLVIESTSAGVELAVAHDSWFIAGTAPWKPVARRHFERAAYIVKPHELATCSAVPLAGAT